MGWIDDEVSRWDVSLQLPFMIQNENAPSHIDTRIVSDETRRFLYRRIHDEGKKLIRHQTTSAIATVFCELPNLGGFFGVQQLQNSAVPSLGKIIQYPDCLIGRHMFDEFLN